MYQNVFILIMKYYINQSILHIILFSYYLCNYTRTLFVSVSSLVKCNVIGLGIVGMDRLVGNWHELIRWGIDVFGIKCLFEDLKNSGVNFQCLCIIHYTNFHNMQNCTDWWTYNCSTHTYQCNWKIYDRRRDSCYCYVHLQSRPKCKGLFHFLAFEKVCLDFTRGALWR